MITGWGNYIQQNYNAKIFYPKNINNIKKILKKKI